MKLYIVGADSNTKFKMEKLGSDITPVEATMGQSLSCAARRVFWVSWHNTTQYHKQIRVGEGSSPNKHTQLSFLDDDTNQPVIAFVTATTGGGHTGEWSFMEVPGKYDTNQPVIVFVTATTGGGNTGE